MPSPSSFDKAMLAADKKAPKPAEKAKVYDRCIATYINRPYPEAPYSFLVTKEMVKMLIKTKVVPEDFMTKDWSRAMRVKPRILGVDLDPATKKPYANVMGIIHHRIERGKLIHL